MTSQLFQFSRTGIGRPKRLNWEIFVTIFSNAHNITNIHSIRRVDAAGATKNSKFVNKHSVHNSLSLIINVVLKKKSETTFSCSLA